MSTDTYRISTGVEDLLQRAREITGIDHPDPEAREPLGVLLRSLNEESQLHREGAVAMENKLVRLLANRLRMQRDLAANPEILAQPVRAPIVICGMGRTGSTKLQKLLAASGDFNWLPFWQAYNPCLLSGYRSESPQQRIRDAEQYCTWYDEASPENRYGHHFEAHEPDEESYMLEQSLRTACFIGWTELPSYIRWLMTSGGDIGEQFHFLKQLLQYLQWQGLQDPGKRWVLKCPLYFGLEPLLLEVFPDAQLLMTHRHPRETIPSSCRLLQTFHEPWTEAPIDFAGFLAGMAGQIEQHLAVRAANPGIRYLDIDFRQTVANVDAVIEQVYAFCNETLGPESLRRMMEWNTRNPKDKKGIHRYSLPDYGFSEAMIDQAFAGYIALLDRLFGAYAH
jgi:hypothetical protein